MTYKYVVQSNLSLTATMPSTQVTPSAQYLSCIFNSDNVRLNWVQPKQKQNKIIQKYNIYINGYLMYTVKDLTQINIPTNTLIPYTDQGFQILKFSIAVLYKDGSQSRKKNIYIVMVANQVIQIQFDQQYQLSFGDQFQLDLGD